MLQMEIDSPAESAAGSPHRRRIIQRLSGLGIPREDLIRGPSVMVALSKTRKFNVLDLALAILPIDGDVVDEDVFRESTVWLQWLMFEGDPSLALEQLAKMGANQRGVCGFVWGNNGVAYHCRTCQHDLTCAICAPCFGNGNHKDHDYFVVHSAGGCCDCGDTTAWNREGFCSNHRGAGQIVPLPAHVAESLRPVMDVLLRYWTDKLRSAKNTVVADHDGQSQKVSDELSSVLVGMLLDFHEHSESLFSFISQRVHTSAGLLDLLMRADGFMNAAVVTKLHELLLKMLGEPQFKYEFAKVFVFRYIDIVNAAVSECSDAPLKNNSALSAFSVQIFTVPTLMQRLVEEMNLLSLLLQCLEKIFCSCAGPDGRLQVSKWAKLYKTTIHVVEDIKLVMSHSAVSKYLFQQRLGLTRTWMRLLTFMQGMDTQKRETDSHIEAENDITILSLDLCRSISDISSLLVARAFSVSVDDDTSDGALLSSYKLDPQDQDSLRHYKVRKISQESSVCSITGKRDVKHESKAADSFPLPSSALWLINECLKSIDNWLGLDNVSKVEGTSELEGLGFLSLSRWPDKMYDVSSEEISVHIPLHRLLSMVLRRALPDCCGLSGSSYALSATDADRSRLGYGDFLTKILNGCHPYGFAAFMMEHPLRIRVFFAQVHAGIWGRNSRAPILFDNWYHAVRCSDQGQELDLFLLQCCAALAPPDLFVQRILERFGLSNYLSLNPAKSTEHEPVLVAEMLTLLIQIAKERRFCGLTSAECLQRELVYKLAIGDATRSQLLKSLPRDLSKVDKFNEVLDSVAECLPSPGMTEGMYRLRLPFWKEFDIYHPRWNLKDFQAALERYLQIYNVSALANQLPRWTEIYQPLEGVAKIVTCETLLQIIRAVVFYAVTADELTTSRAAVDVLLMSLHLLALVLDVCGLHKDLGGTVLAFASVEISASNGDQSLLSLLVLLLGMHGKEDVQNSTEAGNGDQSKLSSLVRSLIKTCVDLDPRCMSKLQNLAPQLADQMAFPSSENI